MKKKLALLLAAIMVITCLPMTAMAASSNTVTPRASGSTKYVVLEQGIRAGSGSVSSAVATNNSVENWVSGGDLRIELNDDVAAGHEFRISLNNARFAFANGTSIPDRVPKHPTATSTAGVPLNMILVEASGSAGALGLGTTKNVRNATGFTATTDAVESTSIENIDYYYTKYVTSGLDIEAAGGEAVSPTGSATTDAEKGSIVVKVTEPAGAVNTTDVPVTAPNNVANDVGTGTNTATYNYSKGAYFANLGSGKGVYVRFPVYDSGTGRERYNDSPYVMVIDTDGRGATIIVADELLRNDVILIPMVTTLTGDDDYTVTVESNTRISQGTYTFADKIEGRTKVNIASTATFRDSGTIPDIVIREQRIGSLKTNGQLELKAPNGYEFSIVGDGTNSSSSNTKVYIDLDAKWSQGGNSGLGVRENLNDSNFPSLNNGTVDSNGDYTLTYKPGRGNTIDRSIVVLDLLGVTPSATTRGALTISKLYLVAEDEDNVPQDKEIFLTLTDTGSTGCFTDETFKVATITDYLVSLTTVTDVPTLVSGRLEGWANYNKNGEPAGNEIDDDYHLAAEVKFAEKLADSWWAERTTKFELPADVTAMKVQFRKFDKIDDGTGGNGILTEWKRGDDGTTNAVYYNLQKRSANGLVTVSNNTITLSKLKTTSSSDKGTFQMKIWLSIDPTFEGDIDLQVYGGAIREMNDQETLSVTIAKAIRPVEVTTKVSEVQVGYQYFSVGDFEIAETAAGNLLLGKDVYISVTDGLGTELNIAPGFTRSISQGDLKISGVRTAAALGVTRNFSNAGQLEFTIDRESTEASTISFSGIQVKVDRNVPYSNLSATEDRGLDLYVWGPAIAQNYYYLPDFADPDHASVDINLNDTFMTPGISAKYIHVATTADNNVNAEFVNAVEVTIGNPVIKINGQDFTMPVAAYISTASNSTMVPLRFVANALGLPEDSVKWDDANRIATVMSSNRIVQFQIGNNNYFVNNAPIPMGPGVVAEITNDRTFIPFRALGEAFGIVVDWDAATSTAKYNVPTNK